MDIIAENGNNREKLFFSIIPIVFSRQIIGYAVRKIDIWNAEVNHETVLSSGIYHFLPVLIVESNKQKGILKKKIYCTSWKFKYGTVLYSYIRFLNST